MYTIARFRVALQHLADGIEQSRNKVLKLDENNA